MKRNDVPIRPRGNHRGGETSPGQSLGKDGNQELTVRYALNKTVRRVPKGKRRRLGK